MVKVHIGRDLPVYEDATASIEPILDEPIARRKVLDKVFIVHVVDLDDHMLKAFEQFPIERQSQHRQYVRDATGLQRLSAA